MRCRVKSVELPNHVGERVSVAGWLQAHRRLGGIVFTVIRDGWGCFQLVTEQGEPAPDYNPETPLLIAGTVVREEKAPLGVELRACEWQPVGEAEPPPLALGKKEMHANQHVLLDNAAIGLRHPGWRRVFRVSAALLESFRATLRRLDFTEITSPKIVSGAAEGGANVFQLDYFGRPAFLAQSPQLYKQMLAGVFERVFEVGPVFRAEPHDTVRHLHQYPSLDGEMCFIADHKDVMAVVEEVAAAMVEAAVALAPAEGNDPWQMPVMCRPFPALPFWEAQAIVAARTGRDISGEPDLAPEDERELGRYALAKYGSDFLFVTGYPMRKRPFYTYPDPEHSGYSRSFDLLFRGTEVVTGGQRLHLYRDYQAALAERGIDSVQFAGYLTAFRHGMPPHGGFGMGLERMVAQLLGLTNIRLACLFPRTLTRLQP